MIKSNHQIPILDSLRAIAAWSVCLYHFVCSTVGFIDKDSFAYSFFYFGSNGVNLFFIISGLVIPWSLYHSNYRLQFFFKFFLKRLIRLEPPYLVSIILTLIVFFLRKYNPLYHNTVIIVTGKQLLFHIGYLIPFSKDLTLTWINNIYWTLAIEFQYYIAIGGLYFLFKSKHIHLRVVAYTIIIGSKFIIPLTDFLPYWLSFFGIGILIFLYKINRITLTEFILISFVFVMDIFIFNEKPAAIVAMVSEAGIIFMFNKSYKVLAWLGKFSYSFYLIHAVLGMAVVNFLSHYANTVFSKLAVLTIGLIITFFCSYIMYWLVEKPSKKLSSKLVFGKKQ